MEFVTKKSCNTCHGWDGVGGVTNTNYALPTIPALNTMAQKLKIPDLESSELVLNLLEQKTDLDSLADNPPFNTYSRFFAQYKSIKQKIYDGSPVVQKLDTAGPAPPLTMPSWKHNLSEEEINSIIGFLISLNNWEDEL